MVGSQSNYENKLYITNLIIMKGILANIYLFGLIIA